MLGPANPASGPGQKGAGGTERGGTELMLEFKVDDVIDWMWEELQLPNLQPRSGLPRTPSGSVKDGTGAGRGRDWTAAARSRSRSNAAHPTRSAFTDEDLRFRQLTRRRQPAVRAAVFFLLDVSASMTESDRQLAKTFFFWVAAGLRREYRSLDIVFVAHTTDAWEFGEADFFKVAGSGGTVASAGLTKMCEIMQARFDPANCNYLFYASDGDNAADDRAPARELESIAKMTRYAGYVEISPVLAAVRARPRSCSSGWRRGIAVRPLLDQGPDDVVAAVRHFFTKESNAVEAAGNLPRDPIGEPPAATRGSRRTSDSTGPRFSKRRSFMTEIAVYGLPVRMPHWSFGARYIYQLLQRHMGYSRLFEVCFPAIPVTRYLAASNGMADNMSGDRPRTRSRGLLQNNLQFRRSQEQGSEHIIEHAASHARQIERDIEAHGFNAVEQVLDAALSLEQYIDLDHSLRRERYPEYLPDARRRRTMRSVRASRRSMSRPCANAQDARAAAAASRT